MKTKSSILSIIMIMVVLISACSSPAATPAATEAPATQAPAATTAPTEEPTSAPEITLTVWTDESEFKSLTAMIEPAQKEYGINLVVQQIKFDDLWKQFQTAAPAGSGPDILIQPHNLLGQLVQNGLIVPLNLGDVAAQYAPAALNAWQYNGEQYGLPINTENVGFFINTDIVPNCPATWTEVMDISKTISANNTDKIETNKYGFVENATDVYHWYGLMTAFGGYVFGMTDKGYNPQDVGLDSEGTIAAANFWDSYIKAGLQPAGVSDDDTMTKFFITGQSAMMITGPWNTNKVIDAGIKFKICPIPGEVKDSGEPFMGSFGYIVSAFSKNVDTAQIFVNEFLSREENMRLLYDEKPNVPANLAVLASINDPNLAAYGVAGKDAQPMPAIPEMNSVWAAWANALTLVSNQGDTPENAFKTAADQVRKAIAEGK